MMQEALFWVGLVLMAVDAAISTLLTVLVEKDYVRELYAKDVKTLADANAWVMRTDLGSSVGTYTALAWAVDNGYLSEGRSLVIGLGAWHIFAAVAVMAVLAALHHSAPSLGETNAQEAAPPSMLTALCDGARVAVDLEASAKRTLIAMLVLYFTVLSPSSLFTAYLASRGVGAGDIASFRSAAQLVGFLGTIVAPPVIRQMGVAPAGVWLQRLQLVFILACPLAVFVPGWPNPPATLMVAVVSSRVGLWGFDLCERAMLQLSVAPDRAVKLFSFERAAGEVCVLIMLVVSLIFPDPEDFGVLVCLSAGAVTTCAIILAGQRGPAVGTTRVVGTELMVEGAEGQAS